MATGSDTKPTAVSGPVMRRTDDHIAERSKITSKRSGDNYIRPPLRNTVLLSFPDSDERWGKTPLDPDWPE